MPVAPVLSAWVGVPVTSPVCAFSDSPAGSEGCGVVEKCSPARQASGTPVRTGLADNGTPTLPSSVVATVPFEFQTAVMPSTAEDEQGAGSAPPPQEARTTLRGRTRKLRGRMNRDGADEGSAILLASGSSAARP